ncbi:SGNH/GDSL hydrolase family protein [Agreia sp. VKM Ac-1783]|uniref:SGNH/GDSL hydrolase family protein n=1 Tax=Agreia sp. VKM Ac-1783 TaxID=1938889 RepID=UPI000A2AB879|nr:SGNH/GDSL hydrolase family protein [Agreia sp. VKM Ac-1783]SMQ57732.1 Lysophospholipase L1 [Agreia sp. VKM Ac-1783]
MNLLSLWPISLIVRHRETAAARIDLTIPVNSAFWRARQKKAGELLYVVIGDSAAQGIGASKPYRGYVQVVANHFAAETGRTVRIVNLSVAGARLREALAIQMPKLAKLLRDATPDLMTVSIGANDINSFEKERFARELEELYSQLPSTAIVADLPCFHIPQRERLVAVANRIVRATAERHGLTVAPLYAVTKRQGIVKAVYQSAADLFHPNDRGYRVWASAFLPEVASRARRVRAREATSPTQ